MIYIVRKSIRRTGRVIFEKTFMNSEFKNNNAYEFAFNIALAEDRAKKDTEVVELIKVSGIVQF